MESRSKVINYRTVLSSAAAVGGIYYSIKSKKNFWSTVGFTLLFSIVGAGVGTAIDSMYED